MLNTFLNIYISIKYMYMITSHSPLVRTDLRPAIHQVCIVPLGHHLHTRQFKQTHSHNMHIQHTHTTHTYTYKHVTHTTHTCTHHTHNMHIQHTQHAHTTQIQNTHTTHAQHIHTTNTQYTHTTYTHTKHTHSTLHTHSLTHSSDLLISPTHTFHSSLTCNRWCYSCWSVGRAWCRAWCRSVGRAWCCLGDGSRCDPWPLRGSYYQSILRDPVTQL